MRVLVTGVKGQLGFDCMRELKARGFLDVLGIDIEQLDITDEAAVHRFVADYRPDVIIHNAAWTAVDKAEEVPDKVYAINALGPKYLAEAANEIGCKIIYPSTDYVFPGDGEEPYSVESATGPKSVYGATKLAGEEFVRRANPKYFIVRISWVFGVNGHNFVRTMLNLGKSHDSLTVVNDQIGSPTYTPDLARLFCDMLATEKYGTYHATNEGFCSWADFAREIFSKAGKDVKVIPVSTADYLAKNPNQARRPFNSRLSKKSLDESGFRRLPTWQDALSRFLKELSL